MNSEQGAGNRELGIRNVRSFTQSQEAALDLTRSLAVTAGAGSGKTTVLVERYVRTLAAGASPGEVLAITFTKKAAAEMRARVAERLTALRGGAETHALAGGLAGVPISTIHAFCSNVLREFAIEADVDPDFEVLEATEQRLLLRETIEDWLRESASPSPLVPGEEQARHRSADRPLDPAPLGRGFAQGERVKAATEDLALLADHFSRRELARALEGLLDRRPLASAWARDLLTATAEELMARWRATPGGIDMGRALEDQALATHLDVVAAVAALPVEDDPLVEAARAASALRGSKLDRRAILASGLLNGGDRSRARSFGNLGSRARFGARADLVGPARVALSAIASSLEAALDHGISDLDAEAIPLLRALASSYLDVARRYRARKDARSVLDFDDLLEVTEHLLRDPAHACVRRTLRARYRAILVDELQDLDPVQWRIIEALATGDEGAVIERRLFAVGDEKQSIYRFRGADVSIFRRLTEGPGGGVAALALDDNFRSLPPLVAFVNDLFDRIFGAAREPFEARPGRLVARRTGEADRGLVEVVVRGGSARDASPRVADDGASFRRGLEEAELAAAVARREIAAGRDPCEIAILLRQRTHLKLHEEALRRLGIPFVVAGGLGFYRAPEVMDAANLTAFLADERADIALAGVLRSPLASLTDGALYLVASHGPPGEPLYRRLLLATEAGSPLEGDDLAAALAARRLLERLRASADRIPAAELVREAFESSGAAAAIALGPRGPQALANISKLLDLIRRFEERGLRGLAHLSEMLLGLIEADEVEGEADRPEPAPRAVQILTVHASKGLEFPVVVVPMCGARFHEEHEAVLLEETADGRPEVGLTLLDPLSGHTRAPAGLRGIIGAGARRRAEAEMRRLFYTACTRARDTLVLIGTDCESPSWLSWTLESGVPPHRTTAAGELLDHALPPLETQEDGSLSRASRAPLEPLPEPPRSAFLTPSRWKSFREAPAEFFRREVLRLPDRRGPTPEMIRGTVIHRLLELGMAANDLYLPLEVERILLEEGAGGDLIDTTVAAARRALACIERSDLGRDIREAAEIHRERGFALLFESGLLEGRVDLMLRRGSRWRVVDWKTDDVVAGEVAGTITTRGYDLQLELYALAAMRALGLESVDATLFFTGPGVAVDRRLDRSALECVAAAVARDLARIEAGEFALAGPREAQRA